eukprot:10654724-Heterocapsa_arctica.AAC.2
MSPANKFKAAVVNEVVVDVQVEVVVISGSSTRLEPARAVSSSSCSSEVLPKGLEALLVVLNHRSRLLAVALLQVFMVDVVQCD